MEYQTWTRKANAIDAVKKVLAAMTIHDDILITDVEAIDEGAGHSVTVHVEFPKGATIANDEFDAFVQGLAPKARVKAVRAESAESELPESKPKRATKAELGHLFTKQPHETKASQRRLTCQGANPFKRGKSYDAWEWLAANPGATYAECKAAGCRMRAISHSITMGWVTVE